MKKLILTALLAAAANADIIGAGIGLGAFYGTPSGNARYDGDEFGLKSAGISGSSNIYGWAYLEHFVPIIPNLRLDIGKFERSGGGEANFAFGGKVFSGETNHVLRADQTDLTGYYILPVPLIDLRLGLSVSRLDLEIKFSKNGIEESADGHITLPMVYGGARFEIPSTNLAVEADIKYMGYKKSSIANYRAKIDYTFDYVLKAAIEAGYKKQEISIKDLSGFDGEADIAIDGFFAGVAAKF